jgi:hypothetical protein
MEVPPHAGRWARPSYAVARVAGVLGSFGLDQAGGFPGSRARTCWRPTRTRASRTTSSLTRRGSTPPRAPPRAPPRPRSPTASGTGSRGTASGSPRSVTLGCRRRRERGGAAGWSCAPPVGGPTDPPATAREIHSADTGMRGRTAACGRSVGPAPTDFVGFAAAPRTPLGAAGRRWSTTRRH